jgi:hypothetical protein
MTLYGICTLSYGSWLGLSVGVSVYLYGLLVLSALLSFVESLYVRKWLGYSWGSFALWYIGGLLAGMVAAKWPWVAVAYLIPLDAGFYVRAGIDLMRSRCAKAVSVWAWVGATLANVAWGTEALMRSNWALFAQCLVLFLASGTLTVLTGMVHGRESASARPSISTV